MIGAHKIVYFINHSLLSGMLCKYDNLYLINTNNFMYIIFGCEEQDVE